jgi:opacity protein-like surface antigen
MSQSMMKRILLAGAVLAGLAVPAFAGGSIKDAPAPVMPRVWYMSAFGGWSTVNNYDFDFVSNAGARFAYTAPLDNGYVLGGAVGWVVNPNLRLELEVAHLGGFDFVNTYRGITEGFTGSNPSGSMRITTVMVNAWLNTQWGNLQPYIGGGVGAGFAKADLTVTNGSGAQFGGSDSGLAFQLGAGIRMPISNTAELDFAYRMRGVNDVGFDSRIAGFRTTQDTFITHSVQVGVNFKF